jgi:hypothetical protein
MRPAASPRPRPHSPPDETPDETPEPITPPPADDGRDRSLSTDTLAAIFAILSLLVLGATIIIFLLVLGREPTDHTDSSASSSSPASTLERWFGSGESSGEGAAQQQANGRGDTTPAAPSGASTTGGEAHSAENSWPSMPWDDDSEGATEAQAGEKATEATRSEAERERIAEERERIAEERKRREKREKKRRKKRREDDDDDDDDDDDERRRIRVPREVRDIAVDELRRQLERRNR